MSKEYNEQLPIVNDDTFSLESESDFNKIVEKLFNTGEIELITDLSKRDIGKLTKLKVMADYYDIPLLNKLYYRFILLRVSNKREGRKEGVSLANQIINYKRIEGIQKAIQEGVNK